MLNIFKTKPKTDSTIWDLALKIEHQQKQMDELRGIILELSQQVNALQIEINYLTETKWGKGI